MTLPTPKILEPSEVSQPHPNMNGNQIDVRDHLGLIKAVVYNGLGNRLDYSNVYMHLLRNEIIRARELTSIDPQDLCQDGYFGLKIAAEKFDPSLGFAFSTFAVACIANSIRKPLPRWQLPIAYPMAVWQEVVHRRANALETVPNEDKADTTSYVDEDELDHFEQIVPLDEIATTPLYDSEDVRVTDEIETITRITLSKDLEMVLTKALRAREREIIKFRFGFEDYPRTLDEVAERFSISRERARAIQERAIAKLRSYLHAYRIREPFNEYDSA